MWESKRARHEGEIKGAKGEGSGHFQQGQGSSNTPSQRFTNDKVQNPKAKGDGGISFPRYPKCGRNHGSKCLTDMGALYMCGQLGHKLANCRSCPN